MPTCEDDLTLTDLITSSLGSTRLTSGSSSQSNLFPQIDRDNVHALNLEQDRSSGASTDAKSVIKDWEERDDEAIWIESGVDDQLILNIPFIQNVRIRSILIKTGRGEEQPSVLRLYANRTDGLQFSESPPPPEGLKPSQELSLFSSTSNAVVSGVTEYPLKVQVFKDVVSMSLFFGESEGGEKTRIYFIGFLGDPRNPTKSSDTEMTIPAAQGADAPIGGVREAARPRDSTIR